MVQKVEQVVGMCLKKQLRLLEVLELSLEPLGVSVQLVGGLLQFSNAVVNLFDLLQVWLQAFVWGHNERLKSTTNS